MAETQTWRIDTGVGVLDVMVRQIARERWRCPDGHHEMTALAAARAWAYRNCVMGMALAPGEPTRAEAVAAERERCARLCDEVAKEREQAAHDAGLMADHIARKYGARAAEMCAKKIRAGGV